MRTLRVATCQFAVEGDISLNRKAALKQLGQAADRGAQVAHFSETALSGYAGIDVPNLVGYDWDALRAATKDIMAAAGKLKLWVVLGSMHYISPKHKPHNSLYIINPDGEIVDRYDKRFCTGKDGRTPTMDLEHYSPGDRCTTWEIDGVKCGGLICFDYRFPELAREYKRLGTEVMFHSFHNARRTPVANRKYNIWKWIVPATMACRAAENHWWISANNSQTRPSCWPSFTVRPDGQVMGQLELHKPGVLITEMTLDAGLFDAPAVCRSAAMQGILHNGKPPKHARSKDRCCL